MPVVLEQGYVHDMFMIEGRDWHGEVERCVPGSRETDPAVVYVKIGG